MGLTKNAVGKGALDTSLVLQKRIPDDRVIALAGNPNVGKSTVFNALTGMNQHTGNWPGKTVASAQGYFLGEEHGYLLVDIPGTYSLLAHSAEEEVARNFICFESPDAAVVVCDATCLERNLNLVLQIMECGVRTAVCVNLLDEAERKGIRLDLDLLSARLGVPVIGVTARKKRSLRTLTATIERAMETTNTTYPVIPYPLILEDAIRPIMNALDGLELGGLDSRWIALRLLDGDAGLMRELEKHLGSDVFRSPALSLAMKNAETVLEEQGIDRLAREDVIVSSAIARAEELCRGVVTYEKQSYLERDRKIDKILTGRVTAYPVMLLLLALIFWLTVTVSNIPSEWLSTVGFGLIERLATLLTTWRAPPWLIGVLTDGILRVLVWVVSVMLPPMAIFFPLFTLLEDMGYLPRVAYNLDRHFQRCHACGKQSLTMCVVDIRMQKIVIK